MAAVHAAYPRAAVPVFPTTRVAVPVVQDNVMEKIGMAGGGLGFLLVVAGITFMGFTLYGTQRTTAQILLNQPAAVQNLKKGLMTGVKISGAGLAVLVVALPFTLIGGKMHH